MASKKKRDSTTSHKQNKKRQRMDAMDEPLRNNSKKPKTVISNDQNLESPRLSIRDSMPTDADYRFRLKVISSSRTLDDDIFDEAVQGLIKICFPDGVLTEIGMSVIERHMLEANVSTDNIQRMQLSFRTKMIGRVARMLAEFLDTPEKLQNGIQAVIMASFQQNGVVLDKDMLDKTISNLKEISHEYKIRSSTQLVHDTAVGCQSSTSGSLTNERVHVKREPLSDCSVSTADHLAAGNVEEFEYTGISRQNHVFLSHDTQSTEKGLQPFLNTETVVNRVSTNHLAKEKERSKLSRWDVDPSRVTAKDVKEFFKRTRDLFSFHVLPLIQRDYPDMTKREEIRTYIHFRYSNLSKDELGEWKRRFRNLQDGDMTMLHRPMQEDRLGVREGFRATATSPNTPESPETLSSKHKHAPYDMSGSAGMDKTVPLMPLTIDSQHLVGAKLDTCRKRTSKNPIYDLLARRHMGRIPKEEVVTKVLEALNKRVASDFVATTHQDGTSGVTTKHDLESSLLALAKGIDSKTRRKNKDFRQGIENTLVPWVLASLASFPELKEEPFIFTELMTYCTPVLDILGILPFPDNMSANRCKGRAYMLFRKLNRKGHMVMFGKPITRDRIVYPVLAVLEDANLDAHTKRCNIEKQMRRIAFYNRSEFPELKEATLVICWEILTGMEW
ncbi:hypothetical protein BS50DRAFT_681543 [Corynespora cassiicola Philippines]|uniref:Uncharacterized protein n=1 Tax=Corynespora cassiicola Philippines TaxID=1448308 RepID=A0A2T2N5C0_CORCC|nr:hypothetical protein BS50DRAFT_681543 [Corynespora cassiicola Philippines]